MGNSGSAPAADPTGTDTPSQTPTRSGTGTRTPSITPNISDMESSSASASGSFSPSASHSASISGSSSASANITNSQVFSRTSAYTAAATPTPVASALPITVCGSGSYSQGTWKTHSAAGISTYTDNANCITTYTATAGQIVRFTVLSQQLEACCDHVYLYDGSSIGSTRLADIVGTSITSPGTWASTGSALTIHFTTDASVVLAGLIGEVNFIDSVSSSTPLQTGSRTVSPGRSTSPSSTRPPSVTNSAQKSLSTSPWFTISPTGSPSISNTIQFTLTSIESPSISNTPLISLSSTESPSISNTPISSFVSSESVSPTLLSTRSQTSSGSLTLTISPTQAYTFTHVNSHTVALSTTPRYTTSTLNTVTITFTRSPSLSFTQSQRSSLSGSPSSIATPRPKGPPPALPADLTTMSVGQLNYLFNDFAFYDPAAIQGSLQLLGMAGLKQSGGEFAVSTDAFALKIKAIDSSVSSAIQMGDTSLALPPLNALGSGLAASIIQWTNNPYSLKSSTKIDTPTLSLNIIDTNGAQLSVKNLSSPIAFSWALDQDDPRFQPPPFYMARCDIDELYTFHKGIYILSNRSVHVAPRSWSVPCLLDVWRPLNCTATDTVKTLQCPSAIFTPECLYWNVNQSAWSSDGCVPSISNSIMQCHCTHLTDFSSRINAVGQANQAVFANAANVYSVSGLSIYAQWFGIFGGIAFMTLILGMLSMRIDNLTTKKYVKELCADKTISRVFENAPNSAIYVYDKGSTRRCSQRPTKKSEKKIHKRELSLCQRLFQQHTRLQFLFRYDPRLARIFRLLSLFTIQYHSLFVSALLYGFTYGAAGKEAMAWNEILILSLITSALNIPVVRFILSSLESIGIHEFNYKFPLLCEEYRRRSEFETLALVYLKKGEQAFDSKDIDANQIGTILGNGDDEDGDDPESGLINLFLMYVCCRGSRNEEDEPERLSSLSRKELLVRMIKLLKRKYPGVRVYDAFWSTLPCHTQGAWIFLLFSSGWIAWCLNFLLLFAASHPQSVGENIMISYATSELTTIFLSQPLTIIITYTTFKVLNKYGKYLPKFLQRYAILSSKNKIPALYYFSNPWKTSSQSAFTSELAYSLFVRCPSIASNTNELAYAPTNAIIHDEHGEHEPCHVEVLYNKILKVRSELAEESRELP